MKSSILTIFVLSVATTILAQYDNQSAPFYLIAKSSNQTLNGSIFSACHEGAAIEGLCLGSRLTPATSPHTSQYQFNTSSYPSTTNATIGAPGYLTYTLVGGNFVVSEPMGLVYNPVSNVAVPEFFPGSEYATVVAFDSKNRLNIQGYLDDRVQPITGETVKAYYRWYVCNTYAGYAYTTLAWVVGDRKPENPSCVKVEVIRVFV